MQHSAYMASCIQTALGLYQAESKTTWEPNHRLTFLGFVVDSKQGTVEIEEHKYQKFCAEIKVFLEGEPLDITDPVTGEVRNISKRIHDGHALERLRGQCVSFLLVCPHLCLYIVEMTQVINWCYRHSCWFVPGKFIFALRKAKRPYSVHIFKRYDVTRELMRWVELAGVNTTRKIFEAKHDYRRLKDMIAWTDASGYQGGSLHEVYDPFLHKYVVKKSAYMWAWEAEGEAINFKELIMILLILQRYGPDFSHKRLTIMCDNQCTVYCWKK